VVRAAERYYRAMCAAAPRAGTCATGTCSTRSAPCSTAAGPEAKAVVWAHNSHIGNAAATAMGWQGEFNIGELCRTAFGEERALIGFGTDRGTVAAARDWGGPMEVKRVRPALPAATRRCSATRPDARAAGPARARRAARGADGAAAGARHRRRLPPDTERRSHYFEAVLPEQFDAFVWFAETRAVVPLDANATAGAADTFPSGL
jgi:erythromycin esterase-like protein